MFKLPEKCLINSLINVLKVLRTAGRAKWKVNTITCVLRSLNKEK